MLFGRDGWRAIWGAVCGAGGEKEFCGIALRGVLRVVGDVDAESGEKREKRVGRRGAREPDESRGVVGVS